MTTTADLRASRARTTVTMIGVTPESRRQRDAMLAIGAALAEVKRHRWQGSSDEAHSGSKRQTDEHRPETLRTVVGARIDCISDWTRPMASRQQQMKGHPAPRRPFPDDRIPPAPKSAGTNSRRKALSAGERGLISQRRITRGESTARRRQQQEESQCAPRSLRSDVIDERPRGNMCSGKQDNASIAEDRRSVDSSAATSTTATAEYTVIRA